MSTSPETPWPTTRAAGGTPAVVWVAWAAALVTFGYMLPWAVAASRGKSNHGPILVVNLLLGWTLVGWIVALVMACGAEPGVQMVPVAAAPVGPPPPGWYPAPAGLGEQFWDGGRWTHQTR